MRIPFSSSPIPSAIHKWHHPEQLIGQYCSHSAIRTSTLISISLPCWVSCRYMSSRGNRIHNCRGSAELGVRSNWNTITPQMFRPFARTYPSNPIESRPRVHQICWCNNVTISSFKSEDFIKVVCTNLSVTRGHGPGRAHVLSLAPSLVDVAPALPCCVVSQTCCDCTPCDQLLAMLHPRCWLTERNRHFYAN